MDVFFAGFEVLETPDTVGARMVAVGSRMVVEGDRMLAGGCRMVVEGSRTVAEDSRIVQVERFAVGSRALIGVVEARTFNYS